MFSYGKNDKTKLLKPKAYLKTIRKPKTNVSEEVFDVYHDGATILFSDAYRTAMQ